jgi:hypothetical protein
MPRPRWLQFCRSGTRWCAAGIGTLLLWTVWLALVLTLVLQGVVGVARELRIPEFALRKIEHRLAAAGLQARFGAATFDPTGRVLLREVQVFLKPLPEPVLTAETLYLEVDPWALLVRTVQIRSVQISGAELLVPALLSPSGRTEPLVREWHALIQPGEGRDGFRIPHLAARVGPVQVQMQGSTPPARTDRPRRSIDAWLAEAAAVYPRLSRQLADQLHHLPLSADSRLTLVLTPEVTAGQTRVEALFSATSAGGKDAPAELLLQDLSGRLAMQLPADRSAARTSLNLELTCGRLETATDYQAQNLHVLVNGTIGATATDLSMGRLDVTAARIRGGGITLGAPHAELDLSQWPRVSGSLAARLFDELWALEGFIHVLSRAGQVTIAGHVPPAMIDFAGDRLQRDLSLLLQCATPPHVQAWLTLGSGGRPRSATARVQSGAVIARGVSLTAAAGVVRWDGKTLHADDILLLTPNSEARGRYEMDVPTREFRFLLSGHLEPADINGWFREWWPNLWSRFDFTQPPAAEVEVSGRWGTPLNTAVFVGADGADVRLQGAEFDRVRTRLFVRPGFVDVLEFIGDRKGREARGGFTRTAKIGNGKWTRITFDAHGNTDLAPAGQLFGELGASITRPFEFDNAPQLHVRGELRSAEHADGRSTNVSITGAATGNWTFYRFPLQDLRFQAQLQDDVLLVGDVEVGFAGGRGAGRGEVRGWNAERELAFDVSLNQARLGESIRTLEVWSAERHGHPAAPESRFQKQVAAGQLDLSLSAEGHYDDPYSLHGTGNAVITGAELGEINLLGILSSLLRPTIFNFTTLQLDTARANFSLVGRTLEFSELRLTGPRAAIEAQGGYRLDTKTLDFAAKIRPFDTSETFLGATFGAVLSPLSSVLEVKLGGALDQPSWSFLYGPTNFLRVLSGEGSRSTEPAASPPASPPPPQT